jgi:hypothetical protein
MRRMLARSLLIGSIAAVAVSGTALGHECFVVSRSDTGNLAAGSHSKVWYTIGTLEDLFGAPGFVFDDPLTGSQLDWALDAARAAGMPNEFTIFVGNHTIAEGTPAMDKHAADGRGIDHALDWFPTIFAIYQEALSH